MSSVDAELAFWKEHREQMRQSESQRAVMTNYLLVIVSGLSGLIVAQHVTPHTTPLGILIVLIGGYGAFAAAKYHERADYHLTQARVLTRRLVAMGALAASDGELEAARDAHRLDFPRLTPLRLHRLWTAIHLGVAVYGVILTCIAAAR